MITISTLLYQGNYTNILNDQSWFLNYNPSYDHKKLIVVNNIKDRNNLSSILESYKKTHYVDYVFVEDFEDQCIKDFNLDINKNTTLGYYYIIPYFVLISKVETNMVFQLSEDCTNEIYFDEDFVLDSIKEINENNKIVSTTLNSGKSGISMGYDTGQWEQIESFRYKGKIEKENEKFWQGVGFSDQLFIASVSKLKAVDYNLETRDNKICLGTPYCPDSWERRVSEYLYQNDLYRGVWKNNKNYYIHGK
jgi:hypothetical protein